MSTGDAPILTGEKPRQPLGTPAAVDPDLPSGGHLRPALDQLGERNVTRTAQVAGLPFVKVPDI